MKRERPDSLWKVSAAFAAVDCLILLVESGFSLVMRRRFVELYADFSVSLPLPTRIILGTPSLLWLACTLLLLLGLIAKEFVPNKRLTLAINLAFFGVELLYAFIFGFVVLLPLIKLGAAAGG